MDLSYIPETKTFLLTDDSSCKLIQNQNVFVAGVGDQLGVDTTKAVGAIGDFFKDKTVLVQQTGLEGYVYKMGTFVQTAGSASLVGKTIILAQAAGVTGLQIIQAQPFLVVALPTVGAMFFHGCGSIAGNNLVGRTCNTIGNTLNIPMAFTESLLNKYAGPVIKKVVGISTCFNYSKQMRRGPGLDSQEALAFLHLDPDGRKSILKTIKCFFIKKLGGKCK